MEDFPHRVTDLTRLPELAFLRYPELNQSCVFQQLRSELEALYSPTGLWAPKEAVLYTSLLACMREAAFTEGKEEREAVLGRVQEWYRRKRGQEQVVKKRNNERWDVRSSRRGLRRSQVISELDARSLSPQQCGLSPLPQIPAHNVEFPSSLFPTTTPAFTAEGSILKRWQEHQQRKHREARSFYISQRRDGNADRDLTPDSFFLTTTGEETCTTEAQLVEEEKVECVSPPPALVDLRSDYLSSQKATGVGTAEAGEDHRKHRVSTQRRSTASSLSHYSPLIVNRPRTPTHSAITRKAIDKPILPNSISPLHRATLCEVDDIKRKLVQKALPCSYRTLQQGLLEPERLPASLLTPQYLPTGGELLMSNPFFNLGKGKKRKLKRKKAK